MRTIDEFDVCPICKHDWSAHFAFLDEDGNFLDEPKAMDCMECYPPFCEEARKEIIE